jgi:hypothetical protein
MLEEIFQLAPVAKMVVLKLKDASSLDFESASEAGNVGVS